LRWVRTMLFRLLNLLSGEHTIIMSRKRVSLVLTTVILGAIGGGTFSSLAQAQASTVDVGAATAEVSAKSSGSLTQMINQMWPEGVQADASKSAENDIDTSNLSDSQRQDMDQIVADHAIITHNGEDTDITIMDSSVAGAYESVTTGKPYSENRKYSGKTRIAVHGALKRGNVDIYIGKNVRTLAHASLGAADLGKIIYHAYGYRYINAVNDLVQASKQAVEAGNTKTGVHIKVRHWTNIKKS